MRTAWALSGLVFAASPLIAASPSGRSSPQGAPSAATAVHETVRPVSRDALPGGTQELIVLEVTFPPRAEALPHRHPAFVYAYVLSGPIETALENEKPRTYQAGQSWHEEPGVLHRVTRNPSRNRTAKLLAIFVAAAGETKLVQPAPGE